MPLLSNH